MPSTSSHPDAAHHEVHPATDGPQPVPDEPAPVTAQPADLPEQPSRTRAFDDLAVGDTVAPAQSGSAGTGSAGSGRRARRRSSSCTRRAPRPDGARARSRRGTRSVVGNHGLDRVVVHHDLVDEAVDQGSGEIGRDRRHETDPQRRQPRTQDRHRDDHPLPQPGDLGVDVHHLVVRDDVGTADLEHPTVAAALPSTPMRYASTSRTAIGCTRVSTHRGVVMTGRTSVRWRNISKLALPDPMTTAARKLGRAAPSPAPGRARPRDGSRGAATAHRRRRRPVRRGRRSDRRRRSAAASRKFSAAVRSRVCQSESEPIECTR